jgi:hypothetical protein
MAGLCAPYRRFAAALTDCDARLGADMDRYSFIASDLHRLLVAGLPAHCVPHPAANSYVRIIALMPPAVSAHVVTAAERVRDRGTPREHDAGSIDTHVAEIEA